MNITQALKTDWSEINQFREIISEDKSQPHRLKPLDSEDLEEAAKWVFIIGRVDLKICGFATICPEHANSPKGEITLSIFTFPRGQGYGEDLINEALSMAEKIQGVSKITLAVKKESSKQQGWYEKKGFKPYHTTSTDILMERKIGNT